MPEHLTRYINEKDVTTVSEVAALADGYVLTHANGGSPVPVGA